jgi:hypothetical protein
MPIRKTVDVSRADATSPPVQARVPPRPASDVARVLAWQRMAGNAATTTALQSRPAVVQRTLVTDGPAATLVTQLVTRFAARDEVIDAMRQNPGITLYVHTAPPVADDADADVRTTIQWDAAARRTFILVHLPVEPENPTKTAADLLHELGLHGTPAVLEHVLAFVNLRDPVVAEGDDRVEAEERAQHGDARGWIQMAQLALAEHDWDLLRHVMVDWTVHWEEIPERAAMMPLLERITELIPD